MKAGNIASGVLKRKLDKSHINDWWNRHGIRLGSPWCLPWCSFAGTPAT
jgi:hypothetical protein